MAMGIATIQAIVPTLSGYLNVYYSWHVIFYFSLMVALVALWAIYRYLPVASIPTNILSKTGTVKATFKIYSNTLISPRFFYFTLANTFISGAFFTFVINVPFIVTDILSGNSLDYGNWYLAVALGFWLGCFIASQISERVGNDKMMRLGWGIGILAGIIMFVCIFVYGVSYWSLFTTMTLFTFGRGLSLPNVQVAAATATPYGRSTAMGLFSFCQLLFGAAIAQLSTTFVKQNIILLPIIITLLTIFALMSYFKAIKFNTD
ncbi:MAG: DHA1 family bicyclomycin/chloramphenicol resistance-like MFS transporter [Paraglaciecola sp.]